MGTYTQYSSTASSNNGAAPVGAPEGMAPGSTNDCLRELMATLRSLGDAVADGSLPGSGTPLPLARGGTGSTSASGARGALGLGSAATYTVGTAAGEIPTNAQVVGQVPVGGIVPYWGADGSWPSNWAVCDGTAGTPDLRGLVLTGAGGAWAYGSVGGAETQATAAAGSHSHGSATGSAGVHGHGGATAETALSVAQMPAHTHTTSGDMVEGGSGRVASGGTGQSTTSTTSSAGGGQGHSHGITADGAHVHAIGTDGSHVHTVDVRQPFVCVWMLMRVS